MSGDGKYDWKAMTDSVEQEKDGCALRLQDVKLAEGMGAMQIG